MVRVWVAGKTVWSPCYTRAISERFRDKELIIKRYINSPSLHVLQMINTAARLVRAHLDFCTSWGQTQRLVLFYRHKLYVALTLRYKLISFFLNW